ncbi:hypothetical protein MIR68_009669 [Amoeboaphelidium protococcarum]|nr:hypothetical protein MIR68_009669 [Amoeboaphelidium protococcarum]
MRLAALLSVMSVVLSLNYTQITYYNLGNVNVGEMVVDPFDNNIAYIAGESEGSCLNQISYGGLDALLIKVDLRNSTVYWVKQFGGPGRDYGPIVRRQVLNNFYQRGLAMIKDQNQIAMAFSFTSSQVESVVKRPGIIVDSAIALFSRNGSLVKMISDLPCVGFEWCYNVTSVYTTLLMYDDKAKVLLTTYSSFYEQVSMSSSMAVINPVNSSIKVFTSVNDGNLRQILFTSQNDMLLVGQKKRPDRLYFQQLHFSNYSVMGPSRDFEYSCGGSDAALGSILNEQDKSVIFAGISVSDSLAINGGSGSFIIGRWFYQNSTVQILTRFASNQSAEYITWQDSASYGLYYNELQELYYVYGYLSMSTEYGRKTQAAVLTYSKNYTLLDSYINQDFNFSVVASSQWPYLLVSGQEYLPDAQQSGPVIIKLPDPQPIQSPTTSVVTSQRTTTTTASTSTFTTIIGTKNGITSSSSIAEYTATTQVSVAASLVQTPAGNATLSLLNNSSTYVALINSVSSLSKTAELATTNLLQSIIIQSTPSSLVSSGQTVQFNVGTVLQSSYQHSTLSSSDRLLNVDAPGAASANLVLIYVIAGSFAFLAVVITATVCVLLKRRHNKLKQARWQQQYAAQSQNTSMTSMAMTIPLNLNTTSGPSYSIYQNQ